MLVLSRNNGEIIEFTTERNGIKVTLATVKITDCKIGKCRLVIDAHKDIDIIRPDAVKKTRD